MDQINDQELFESAIADAEVVVETPANDGPARDEMGRFAAKAPEEPQEQIAQPQEPPAAKPDEAHVPSWRLREVNEQREAAERRAQEALERAQALERRFAALEQQQTKQPPQEPANWFENPDQAIDQRLNPLGQRIESLQGDTTFKISRLSAMVEHGKENVLEMEKYLEEQGAARNPSLQMLGIQMRNSDDPVGVAMQWYQRDKLARETGGDLNAYRTKLADDLLKDPAFLAKAVEAVRAQSGQPGAQKTVVQLPPSINRATSAASPHDEPGDLSDRSLYAFATR